VASGALRTTFPAVQMTGVEGTPSGFAYTVEAGANAGSLLYAVDAVGETLTEPREIWRGAPGASYRVVWAGVPSG
ncbi:MAG: hypothetical protein AAF125_05380, partial [Chloroflexota bacterium]